MGCGNSKGIAVGPMPVPQAWSDDQTHMTGKSTTSNVKEFIKSTTTNLTTATGSCDSVTMESQYGSAESVSKTIESRKNSAKSSDSGFSGNSDDVTTEKLTPRLSNVPEDTTTCTGDDAKVAGPMSHRNGLPPVQPNNRGTVASEHGVEEFDPLSLEIILQKRVKFANVLINELPASSDIIKRPVSRGGVAFHIVNHEEEKQVATRIVKKPACVLKYAQHKRAADVVTHDQLDEKLRAANQRKKDQEQMRLERIWAHEEKDRQVAEALAKFQTMQIGKDKAMKADTNKVKRNSEGKALAKHTKGPSTNHRIRT